MAYPGVRDGGGQQIEWGQPGYKRKKFAEYLKAANDLRQSYFSVDGTADDSHGPSADGLFPDGAIIRRGDEEMLLFPSYARKHVKTRQDHSQPAASEEEYWKREFNRHQSDNAQVDVDVRGWLFTPHKGPATRKHRLVLGLARQMSGLPSLSPTGSTTALNKLDTSRSASPVRASVNDEDLIAQEAGRLVRQGQIEERNARHGKYSETPSKSSDDRTARDDATRPTPGIKRQSLTDSSRASTASSEEDLAMSPPQKRSSWPMSGKMTSTEIAAANERLTERLKPFMATPLVNTPVSAFFYNDVASRQHTVYTDASGHFTLRAVLDFVPTHVRVFAGEKLSATEPVIVTAHEGVSLISDVDDTIKHSAISAGAREIFRNVFVRDLGDLTIEGVREWYSDLHAKGVQLHYVSNSPWQLYPLLTAFFKLARLPPGSFHLKQYSGLFQGIFEPVAERKKSSLDKIMRDFPERKFILVGDSGEADLEVYTDTALENPGRILAIFIRDVTTPIRTGFFDAATTPNGTRAYHTRHGSESGPNGRGKYSSAQYRNQTTQDEDADLQAAIAASLADMEQNSPRTAPAKNLRNDSTDRMHPTQANGWDKNGSTITTSPEEEDLIDFSDVPPTSALAPPPGQRARPSPPPPPKPHALRTARASPVIPEGSVTKPSAPPPRKTSSTVLLAYNGTQQNQNNNAGQIERGSDKIAPPLPTRPRTYREFAKEKLTNAYNALPNNPVSRNSLTNNISPSSAMTSLTTSTRDFSTQHDDALRTLNKNPAPPLPPRRNISGLSLSKQRVNASNRNSSMFRSDDDSSLPSSPGESGMSKREFLWRQRWARARSVLEPKGVHLQTWRTGSDAEVQCMRIVEAAMREVDGKRQD